ncbi:hypothetical protein BDV97DRAFT_295003, partial [Delphinella strobiligena]
YRNLTPKTRILIGAAIVTYALAAQHLSDRAEEAFGFTPSAAEKEKLERAMPRIRVLERD